MSEQQDNRSPEQIQRDIDRTRAEMSDTLGNLRQKLSPGDLFEQALDTFKGGSGGEFSSNLVNSVKENPLPVALIGAGIAWLMMGGSSNRSSTSRDWETTGYPRDYVTPESIRQSETTGSTLQGDQDTSSGMRERIGGAAASARESVSAGGQRISSMASSTREGVSSAASSAREGVGSAASSARAGVSSAASSAQERMGDAAGYMSHQARHQGAQVRDTFNYLREEQPLVLGALGFALGAILGTGLPATRREDELMGETRDEMLQRAQEMGEEHLDKAKQVTSAAAEAAKEQADREGLSQEQADEGLRSAGDKLERVVEAASEAAKEEADNQGITPQKK